MTWKGDCTKQWSKKNHPFSVFYLVTQKHNVKSCDCCCLLPHIIFSHVFTIIQFPSHKYSSPLFTCWYTAFLRPNQNSDILCHDIFWQMSPIRSTSLSPDHHISFVAGGNIVTGFFFLPVSWLGPELLAISWQGPGLLTDITERDSEIFHEPNCWLFWTHVLQTDEIPVRQVFEIWLRFF